MPFGVEALEARFLLAGVGATDPQVAPLSSAAPVVMVVAPPTPPPADPPVAPVKGPPGRDASLHTGDAPVLWVVNPASPVTPSPSSNSGPTTSTDPPATPGAPPAASAATSTSTSSSTTPAAYCDSSLLSNLLSAAAGSTAISAPAPVPVPVPASSSAPISVTSPALQPVTLFRVPTISKETLAQDWTPTGGTAGAPAGDHTPSAADGSSGSNPTGVFGVLDANHNWQVYQLSVDPNKGLASVTPAVANPGHGSDLSASTAAPGPSNPADSQAIGMVADRVLTALTNADGSPPQPLPDLAHVSVVGVLDSNHVWRLYRVAVDSNTTVLGFKLSHAWDDNSIPDHMILLDATGRPIADSTPDPQSRVASLDVKLTPQDRPTVVYVKVTAPAASFTSASDSAPQTDNFVLQVTQASGAPPQALDEPQRSTASSGTGTVAQSAPIGSAPASAPARSGTTSAVPRSDETQLGLGQLPLVPIAPAGVRSLNPVATGPMPERAGAALGGVLDEGDPVPQLDRHNPALIDLVLLGLSQRFDGAGRDVGDGDGDGPSEVSDDLIPEATDPLVTIRGPGGFPLLASSLRDVPATDFDALVAALPSAAAATAMTQPASAVEPTSGVRAQVQPQSDLPSRTLAVPSALSGLSVALGMVFGLRLPDLTALLTLVDAPRFRFRVRFGPLGLRGRHRRG